MAALAVALTCGVARARANGKAGWCEARHLSLAAASGPHTEQAQAGGAVLWFLQIRHLGTSACMVENRLTLLSARTASGAPVELRASNSYVFGMRKEPLKLRNSQQAFVELWDPATWSRTVIRGCHDHVVLTFGLAHGRGTLSARPPEGIAMCPTGSMSISATFSSATFLHFIQESSTAPGKVPYARRAVRATSRLMY
jgi:hypothetical protein